MRIGLVNEYYPPFAPGGAEWSTQRLGEALAAAHHVVVITPIMVPLLLSMKGH